MESEDVDMEIVHPEDDEESDDGSEIESDGDETPNNGDSKKAQVYLPGKPLKDDEELVCDDSAYLMLHEASTGAPCLSFDIIPDELGSNRVTFPMTAYIVAGTQAARTYSNNLVVMKMSNLHKTQDESDEEELEDEQSDGMQSNEAKKPHMNSALIKHQGCVNRIRTSRMGNTVYAGTWSETGCVSIWNLAEQLQAVEDDQLLKEYERKTSKEAPKPTYSFKGHREEGFAIDWSPIADGVLATGDCRRDIHVWSPLESGTWNVDQRPLVGHTASVEDLQWSPSERNVLASCSVDKSIRIWDCREKPQQACMLKCENAHQSDINVISWSRKEPFIASGGDDGFLHIWDLRLFKTNSSIATFKHHTGPITTVEWNSIDTTVLATGGEDDQVVLWDIAAEKESTDNPDDDNNENSELAKLPPQLLFIHQGQSEIKELHWHPQMPGVLLSTAHSGFNIFRTISV